MKCKFCGASRWNIEATFFYCGTRIDYRLQSDSCMLDQLDQENADLRKQLEESEIKRLDMKTEMQEAHDKHYRDMGAVNALLAELRQAILSQ